MRAYSSSSNYNLHTLKRAKRNTIAGILAVIYLVISLSPLASLAIYSKSMAYVISNECSGDCNICGCSAESRANRTCCCARKKQQLENVVSPRTKQCSTPQPTTAHTDAKRGCCPPSQPEKPVVAKKSCCLKTSQHPLVEGNQEPGMDAETTKPETVYKCGCPCEKGKTVALAGSGTSEVLPYIYSERIILSYEDTRYFHPPQQLSTRHTEPPDPPPKIFPV